VELNDSIDSQYVINMVMESLSHRGYLLVFMSVMSGISGSSWLNLTGIHPGI